MPLPGLTAERSGSGPDPTRWRWRGFISLWRQGADPALRLGPCASHGHARCVMSLTVCGCFVEERDPERKWPLRVSVIFSVAENAAARSRGTSRSISRPWVWSSLTATRSFFPQGFTDSLGMHRGHRDPTSGGSREAPWRRCRCVGLGR